MTIASLHLEETTPGTYAVLVKTIKIGELYQEIDGFYVWDADRSRAGYLPSSILQEIVDKLNALNKEWQDIINNDPRIGGAE